MGYTKKVARVAAPAEPVRQTSVPEPWIVAAKRGAPIQSSTERNVRRRATYAASRDIATAKELMFSSSPTKVAFVKTTVSAALERTAGRRQLGVGLCSMVDPQKNAKALGRALTGVLEQFPPRSQGRQHVVKAALESQSSVLLCLTPTPTFLPAPTPPLSVYLSFYVYFLRFLFIFVRPCTYIFFFCYATKNLTKHQQNTPVPNRKKNKQTPNTHTPHVYSRTYLTVCISFFLCLFPLYIFFYATKK